MNPLRVIVADMGSGARRVVLSRSRLKVGRVIAVWESVHDIVEQLRADHRRQAPLCRHPARSPAEPFRAESAPQLTGRLASEIEPIDEVH